SPYSRDTSAIDRVVSTTSLATSSRNSGLYLSYFRANSSIPFRSGPYSVRNPEGWRHASQPVSDRRTTDYSPAHFRDQESRRNPPARQANPGALLLKAHTIRVPIRLGRQPGSEGKVLGLHLTM